MSKEALEASIAKWRVNAVSHPADVKTGVDFCPLCDLYYQHNCRGCPVRERTGALFCQQTPYSWAALLCTYDDKDLYTPAKVAEFHEAAWEEVAFLESLRSDDDVA